MVMEWRVVSSIVIMLCGMVCATATAKDLGVYGTTLPIVELDLIDVIKARLGMQNMRAVLQSMEQKMLHPASVIGISSVRKDAVRKFDPTVYLEDDVIVRSDTRDVGGVFSGAVVMNDVVIPKGTAVNPLDYMPFSERLIFIDATDEEQVSFAMDYSTQYPISKIILVKGNPGQQENGAMYFFDQHGVYSRRFGITSVPSIVYQEGAEKVLTVEERAVHEG